MNRYICIHGHFYQPPRENPWLEEVEQQDSAFTYYVKIREYLPSNSVSPPEYVEAQIRSIILNQRKVRFIKELENNIYLDALNKGNFTIY